MPRKRKLEIRGTDPRTRVHINLPEPMLQVLDGLADQHLTSRSAMIRHILVDHIRAIAIVGA